MMSLWKALVDFELGPQSHRDVA